LHGSRLRGCQRMIRITGDTQNLVVLRINTYAHTTLRPAAQATGRAHNLAWLRIQQTRDRINTEFSLKGVATGCVCGCHTGCTLGHTLDRLDYRVGVTSRKGSQTTHSSTAAGQYLSTRQVRGFFFLAHDDKYLKASESVGPKPSKTDGGPGTERAGWCWRRARQYTSPAHPASPADHRCLRAWCRGTNRRRIWAHPVPP